MLSPRIEKNGMPHYFFDIHNGTELQRDTVGVQMDCLMQIRKEVMQSLPAIVRDEILKDGDRQSFMVMVRDENNLVIYTATLSFADSWKGDASLPCSQEVHSS